MIWLSLIGFGYFLTMVSLIYYLFFDDPSGADRPTEDLILMYSLMLIWPVTVILIGIYALVEKISLYKLFRWLPEKAAKRRKYLDKLKADPEFAHNEKFKKQMRKFEG